MRKAAGVNQRRRGRSAPLAAFALSLAAAMCAQAALKTWDVGDYVQDGLIAHYDGIRNAGANLPHDPNATTWADLSPNGTAGAATRHLAVDGHEYGTWKDKAFSTSGWSYFQIGNKLTFGLEFTVQIACDIDKSHWKEEVGGGNNYPCPFGSGEFGFYMDRSYAGIRAKTNLNWKTDAYSTADNSTKNRPSMNWEKGNYINAAMTTDTMYFTADAKWPAGKAKLASGISIPALTYTFAGRSGRSGGNCSLGDYHSVRIYSRKLTDAELALNRTLDEMRFHGADILPVTNVVVMADMLGRTGAEAPGMYTVDGAHVFTASAVTIGGNTYQPVGYTLAAWDEASAAWGNPTCHAGASYEYVVSGSTPKVRLAWQWRLVSGIERLDVWHYVQDGLIANYDGIRNAGERGHDSVAEKWVDCVRGSAGTLWKTKTADGAAFATYGAWTDLGYDFDGHSYFTADEKLELGSEFTVQAVLDTERGLFSDGDEVHIYPAIWSCGEFGMYLDRSYAAAIAATNLFWKEDAYSDGGQYKYRPRVVQWEGKYFSAAFDATYSYMVETPRWKTTEEDEYAQRVHTDPSPVPALAYTWGGRFNVNNTSIRCSKGMFYAWRAYSRKLTDAELAWNRDVDEVRFRGALPTVMSNAVAVVSSREGFAGAEEGVYALGGAHTFTAARTVADGISYAPHAEVETWDAASAGWVKTGTYGDAVTLLEAEGTAPRRIVWKWRKEGFTMTIR